MGTVNYPEALKLQHKLMGAQLQYTQRGGDIISHGPHQAILYPIILLRDIGLGATKYVEKLELTMIELTSMYGVKAQAGQKCETRVWVEDRKIRDHISWISIQHGY
ncbi:hypothetical protein EJD97_023744 [Solanum chilense]|uniref:BPL/LPL catalytic domain-containing protein n=1 Tax=Solanum chilense TaxID=4083 RepID=A0A6N2ARN9_SOLCI|nr:hypothetical protein EJD97_023744 [Solanum chilense]